METVLVLMRADLTGLTMVPLVTLAAAWQIDHTFEVHISYAVILTALFVLMSFLSCKVGLIQSSPSVIKTLSSALVVTSNCAFLGRRQHLIL
jgi:hypothetical protein